MRSGGSATDWILDGAAEAVGFVIGVGVAGVVVEEAHGSVLVIVMDGAFGRVDRQRFVMRSDAVAMRVGIGKDAGLQHFVGAVADAGHLIRGAEGGLLDLREIIFGVAVEFHDADFDQRVVGVGPDFG